MEVKNHATIFVPKDEAVFEKDFIELNSWLQETGVKVFVETTKDGVYFKFFKDYYSTDRKKYENQ